MRTYYNILGVDHKASEQDITDAFLKLAINKTKIKELAEAYEILIDPIKRHQYDKEYLFKLNIKKEEFHHIVMLLEKYLKLKKIKKKLRMKQLKIFFLVKMI